MMKSKNYEHKDIKFETCSCQIMASDLPFDFHIKLNILQFTMYESLDCIYAQHYKFCLNVRYRTKSTKGPFNRWQTDNTARSVGTASTDVRTYMQVSSVTLSSRVCHCSVSLVRKKFRHSIN